jgi:cbb3-type cytochrome oxidase subunit 3
VGALAYQFIARPARRRASFVVGLAVFSHWILDLVVHRPDLPLYDNSAKVGLGLWNAPALALGLEAALLFGGVWLCLRDRLARSIGTLVFGLLMLAVQVMVFFGPPPPSDRAAASTALVAYALFAAVIWWLHDRRAVAVAA